MRAMTFSLLMLLAFIASCARIPFISHPDPLYRELEESFENYDAGVLVGKTIIIDPGHGGRFAGAVGRKHTREADVNLGVALELSRMLSNCGAIVIVTRSGDSDLLSPGEEATAKNDLTERVRLSNEIRADLFLSIHHNATASGGKDYNAIETYYRMEDDGPSLDAARYIHKHLVRNLGIPDYELVPGNYFVLRNNENPSLLGEASYLSNPNVEKKIRDREKQLLEARAYLLGIMDYFSRGIPEVEITRPYPGDELQTAFPSIDALLDPGEGGKGVDISTIRVLLDGTEMEWTYDADAGRLTMIPSRPLVSGAHTLEIRFRNLMGNSSRRTRVEFSTFTEPASLITRTLPERIPAGSLTPFLLEVTVIDRYGNPVADGTEVRVRIPSGIEGQGESATRGGTASFYLTANDPGNYTCRISVRGISTNAELDAQRGALLPLAVRFTDGAIGTPLGEVKVQIDDEQILITNRDGYIFSEGLPRGEHHITAWKDGYVPYHGIINTAERGKNSGLRMLMMDPVFGGALLGKTLVIDPEGGGENSKASGPSGTRSSDLNLRLAQILSDYLKKAGVDVYLTRTGDVSVPLDRRIDLANRVGADMYISIRHDASDRREALPYVSFYGTSDPGKALAETIAAGWSLILDDPVTVRGEYSYVLRQTPCPAVAVMCHDIGTMEREEETYAAAYGLRESYAVFSGIVSSALRGEQDSLGTIRGKVLLDGIGDAPMVLRIDDWLTIGCDRTGRFTVRDISPGEHLVELINPTWAKHRWWVNPDRTRTSPVILTP